MNPLLAPPRSAQTPKSRRMDPPFIVERTYTDLLLGSKNTKKKQIYIKYIFSWFANYVLNKNARIFWHDKDKTCNGERIVYNLCNVIDLFLEFGLAIIGE